MSEDKYSVLVKISRIEGDKVTLELEDGQKIVWSNKNLPEEIKNSGEGNLSISGGKNDEEKEKISREVINQILKM